MQTEICKRRRTGIIQVIYDSSCQVCLEAMSFIQSYAQSLTEDRVVEFFRWESREAEAVVSGMMAQQRPMSCQSRLIAYLPSGIVIYHCEKDVGALMYEIEYLALVKLPSLETTERIEQTVYVAIQEARQAQEQDDRLAPWWQRPHIIDLVGQSLRKENFCVLDDFLPEHVAETLNNSICKARPNMMHGGTDATAKIFKTEGDTTNLSSALDDPSRGDVILFSNHVEGCAELLDAFDSVVIGLQGCDQIAEKLTHVDWANEAMFAIYPGDASRYVKHVDNSTGTDGRRLTAILYLNKGWQPEDGGCCRLFEPKLSSCQVKHDVAPLFNRLLMFWSTDEVPHEVRPTYLDRAAVSVWYFCGRESLGNKETFQDLFIDSKFRCIGGRDRGECIVKAARTEKERMALTRLTRDKPHGNSTSDESHESSADDTSSALLATASKASQVVESSVEAWSLFD